MEKDVPEELAIWQHMDERNWDNLFSRTRELRISEEIALIDRSRTMNNLLLKWTNLPEEDIKSTISKPLEVKPDSFDTILRSVKQEHKKATAERREKEYLELPTPEEFLARIRGEKEGFVRVIGYENINSIHSRLTPFSWYRHLRKRTTNARRSIQAGASI